MLAIKPWLTQSISLFSSSVDQFLLLWFRLLIRVGLSFLRVIGPASTPGGYSRIFGHWQQMAQLLAAVIEHAGPGTTDERSSWLFLSRHASTFPL